MLTCPVSMEEKVFDNEETGKVVPFTAFFLTLPSGFQIRIKTVDSTSKELLIKAIMKAEAK